MAILLMNWGSGCFHEKQKERKWERSCPARRLLDLTLSFPSHTCSQSCRPLPGSFPRAHVPSCARGGAEWEDFSEGKFQPAPKPVDYSPEVSSRRTGWGTSGYKRERSRLAGTRDPDKELASPGTSCVAAQMSSPSLR